MNYPRPGEPIVPRLLRPLVIDRRPVTRPDVDTELLARADLGPGAWTRLPPETCRRLSMLVVDRVQTRINALPALVRNALLPAPRVALALPLEGRTANTIRRALRAERPSPGPWTVDRYLGLRRFGGRALVDLLAAVEDRQGLMEPGVEIVDSPVAGGLSSVRALDEALALIARSLPISEEQASAELMRNGLVADPVDLGELVRTAVRLGRNAPFHIITLGGARMIVRLSDVTVTRATYRIAVRAVQGWGAATIHGIASQLRAVTHALVAASVIERTLTAMAGFRWLDRKEGWFWFAQERNPLVNNLRKVFSVATRLSHARLWSALFRTRAGPAQSSEAIRQICAAVPGTRMTEGGVVVDRPFDRASHLSRTEARIARFLEEAPEGMSERQARGAALALGLPWTAVWRSLRSSPVVERSPAGLFRLVGSVG